MRCSAHNLAEDPCSYPMNFPAEYLIPQVIDFSAVDSATPRLLEWSGRIASSRRQIRGGHMDVSVRLSGPTATRVPTRRALSKAGS